MGEGAVCLAVLNNEEMGSENTLRADRDHPWLAGDTDSVEVPSKQQVKEASNDDVCSEVLNPTVSPRENASSIQTNSSQVAELASRNKGGCCEITSTCSGNSTSDSLSEEEGNRKDTSGDVSMSRVVLEIPKHASSSGIRKITFKFSKRKEHCNQSPASVAQPPSNWAPSGLFFRGPDEEPGTSSTISCVPIMESKMSKKAIPDCYPTNVKKLLSTGILEGARVKYISASGEKELWGIISGCGYLCGCLTCNFSKVLTAYEFELHAGGKTRHPNNHVYLENGRLIYSIVQELNTTPLSELDEVIKDMAGSSVNKEYFMVWRASLEQQNLMEVGNPQNLFHSHLSCPSQAVEDAFGPRLNQLTFMGTTEKRKRVAKKPSSYLPQSVLQKKRSAEGGTKKRDNDLHRLLFMPNGLPDGAALAYCSKGEIILEGYKQGNGIFCNHCKCEISPSQFEAHAGWAARRQPYRHIYTSNGLTLHDIAISLASGQNLTTGDSDDMCTVCGEGGDLIPCRGCPRAFHAACLELQFVPEGHWHCPHCKDNVGPGRTIAAGESSNIGRPIVIRLTRVVKAPETQIGGCAVCRGHDFVPSVFNDRMVIICEQCEREYHVACLRNTGRCDLKELPEDEWFCTDDCGRIHRALQDSVFNGAMTVPDSVLSAISRKYIQRGIIDGTGNDVQWRILNGKRRHSDHLRLLSRAAQIFRECFAPIRAVSGRDIIPVMVHGRNISGQEFGGMYCVVLVVKSVVVSACLLRVFGRNAAELPLVATSRANQGKGYFQALFSSIEGLLYSLNVETIVLPAAEEAESIWLNKFGFRRMTPERVSQFRPIQFTVFNGSSMLEKEVQKRE
ncbi:uncharacterized protein LOC131159172 isoform X2 [Malania oleifera]|uniref:uncharacterized protein LOC131159172 isoform X2 n=1 Tax=Malania oleifera TaxID=397392 RepID=UPI0025ADEDC9|nr:uncharacterized protein LOC131159172 isoform X2 [Malania oleifera]